MKRLTNEEFTEKAKNILGDNYSFKKTKYINSRFRVIITCKKHGDFLAYPNNLISKGCGCPECSPERISKGKTSTTEKFIEKARKIHADKYDYSLVEYIKNIIKVKIICPIHGEFLQTPHDHLLGCGCPKCHKKIKK